MKNDIKSSVLALYRANYWLFESMVIIDELWVRVDMFKVMGATREVGGLWVLCTPKFSVPVFYNLWKISDLIINNLRVFTSKIDNLSKYYI